MTTTIAPFYNARPPVLSQDPSVNNSSDPEIKKPDAPATKPEESKREESENNLKPLREKLRQSGLNAFNALGQLKTAMSEMNKTQLMASTDAMAQSSHDDALIRENESKGKKNESALTGFMSPMSGNVETPDAELMFSLESCLDSMEFRTLRDESYAIKPDTSSDLELQDEISKLIEEMEKNFRDPFMSAAEKMTEYYKLLSSLREIVMKNVGAEKDKVNIKFQAMMSAIRQVRTTIAGMVLYPSSGSTSKADADAWCQKMGAGSVKELPPGSGQYQITIDTAGLDGFIDATEKTFANRPEISVSQTSYNNFMANLDNLLQQENTKTNKLTNQLEYYTKLLDNVRQTINQFIKDMCKLGETIFSNGR